MRILVLIAILGLNSPRRTRATEATHTLIS